MHTFLYKSLTKCELVELTAADGLKFDKVRRLFSCVDSFSAAAAPNMEQV